MVSSWIIVGMVIVTLELILWTIFRLKVDGLSFPRETDESLFRFFTVTRLRLVAILHTLFLFATFMISSYFLW